MRVFVPKSKNNTFFISDQPEILTEPMFCAYFGFSMMGAEIVFYDGNPPEGLSREDVVVGFISQIKMALRNLGIDPPTEIDYPESLQEYLGRKVWKDNLHRIYGSPETWPVFVKPISGKQFNGTLIKSTKELVGIGSQQDRPIWCSEPVNFVTEYRCFIRYGKMIDAKHYKGEFWKQPHFPVVDRILADWKEQPAAFTIDLGLTDDNRTLLIEVNDGFSMGHYGLHFAKYAQMISARWHEMVGVPDPYQYLE